MNHLDFKSMIETAFNLIENVYMHDFGMSEEYSKRYIAFNRCKDAFQIRKTDSGDRKKNMRLRKQKNEGVMAHNSQERIEH